MNLEGIISIAGKAGLYKVISQGKNAVIVESLTDKKRMPITARYQANTLEEIGIYTQDDTKPLSEIFDNIAKREDCKQTISHKSSKEELVTYFEEIIPDYDTERVYISDIKKVVQWYNALQTVGLIIPPKEKKKKQLKL
ncbi:MAG: DUF5606 domain-containing protein [Flavobacteriales bacterium]|nr:DUF5606 domain-containing protein [Flavobacteriales bacterium]